MVRGFLELGMEEVGRGAVWLAALMDPFETQCTCACLTPTHVLGIELERGGGDIVLCCTLFMSP